MENFTFWKSWNTNHKVLLLFCSLLPLVALAFMLLAYLVGDSWFYTWEIIPVLDDMFIPAEAFTDHYYQYKTEVYNYLVEQRFVPTIMNLSSWVTYGYLLLCAGAVAIFLSLITTFKRVWFYLGLGAVMLLFAFSGFEVLELVGEGNSGKMIILLCMMGVAIPAYLIFSFYTNLSIIQRTLIFVGVIVGMGLLVFNLSPLSNNAIALSLVGYGSKVYIAITVVFVAAIAIEPVSFLLFINSGRGNTEASRGSIGKFIIPSLLYLALTVVIYLRQRGVLEYSFGGIDLYVLLIVSSILGFWGFKRRFEPKNDIQNFQYTLLYIVLMTIGLSTVAYGIITDNDSLIDTLGWFMSAIFMCFGASMFVYILYNFYELFMNYQNVYKVMFRPTRMFVFHIWAFAVIAVGAMELQRSVLHWNQAVSGYYNYLGDTYFEQEKLELAKKFYTEAKERNYENRRSNFSLAKVAEKQVEWDDAFKCYEDVSNGGPSLHAYASKAHIYAEKGNYFQAMFTLKDALKLFPENPQLLNNYALLLKDGSMDESAINVLNYSLEKASDHEYDWVQSNNILVQYIRTGNYEKAAGIIKKYPNENFGFLANKLMLGNILNQQVESPSPFDGEIRISQERIAYLVNYCLNARNIGDTATIAGIEKWLNTSVTRYIGEELLYLLAISKERELNFSEAEPIIADMADGMSMLNYHYSNLLGLWYLKQREYKRAQKFFELSIRADRPKALYNLALVNTILNEPNATHLWTQVKSSGGAQAIEQANTFIKLINLEKDEQVGTLDADELFTYLTFVNPDDIEKHYDKGIETEYKGYFQELMVRFLLKNNRLSEAGKMLETIEDNNSETFHLLNAMYYTKIGLPDKALNVLTNNEHSLATDIDWHYHVVMAQRINGDFGPALENVDFFLKKYPHHEGAILEKTNLLNETDKVSEAYEFLVPYVQENPNSPELTKAYILQSLLMNYESFATEGLNDLKELVSLQEYEQFSEVYKKQYAEMEKKAASEEW